jgi:hypothetical protein
MSPASAQLTRDAQVPRSDAHGTITTTVSTSLNPGSPLFQKAEAECEHLIPAGKGPSQAQQQRMKQRLLAFAACMHSHRVPNYPETTFASGGELLHVRFVNGSAVAWYVETGRCHSGIGLGVPADLHVQ